MQAAGIYDNLGYNEFNSFFDDENVTKALVGTGPREPVHARAEGEVTFHNNSPNARHV